MYIYICMRMALCSVLGVVCVSLPKGFVISRVDGHLESVSASLSHSLIAN